MRSAVLSFYRWAVSQKRTDRNPAETLDRVRLPRVLPRPITRDALSQALSDADDRQRLILMLGAVAGLRRAELAGVHMRDIVGQQLLVRGKCGNHRLVPLHPDLLKELDTERVRRIAGQPGAGWTGPYVHHDGFLFPSSLTPTTLTAKHVGRIAQDCLPKGWTLHTLRHRFASHAYAAQRDLRAVQELLGHTKPETTLATPPCPTVRACRPSWALVSDAGGAPGRMRR